MKLPADEETVLRYLELCERQYDIHKESEPVYLVKRELVGKGLISYYGGLRLAPAGERALEEVEEK